VLTEGQNKKLKPDTLACGVLVMADIRLIRSPAELEGTCYFEFLPGQYCKKCWNEGSVFFAEEVFDLIEPIFERHIPGFDHYAFVEVSRDQCSLIINELETFRDRLANVNGVAELGTLVRLTAAFATRDLESAFLETRRSIQKMVADLAAWLREESAHHNKISVLGM